MIIRFLLFVIGFFLSVLSTITLIAQYNVWMNVYYEFSIWEFFQFKAEPYLFLLGLFTMLFSIYFPAFRKKKS